MKTEPINTTNMSKKLTLRGVLRNQQFYLKHALNYLLYEITDYKLLIDEWSQESEIDIVELKERLNHAQEKYDYVEIMLDSIYEDLKHVKDF